MANTLGVFAPEVWFTQIMQHLIKKTVLARLAWTEPSDMLVRAGDTVNLQLPPSFTAQSKVEGSDVTIQSIAGSNVAVVMDKNEEVSYHISAFDAQRSIIELDKDFMAPAAEALARKIETDGMTELMAETRLTAGTAGTTPNALQDVADVNKALDDVDAPDDERHLILGTAAYSTMLGTSEFVSAEKVGGTSTRETGKIGTIFDTDLHKSRYVTSVVGPSNTGTAAINNGAGYPAGTATGIAIDGLTVSLTPAIRAGTVISIAHNAGAGSTIQYVVDADVNTNTAGETTIAISPALEEAAVNNDVITLITGTAVTAVKNVLIHPKAIAFVSRKTVESNPDYPGAAVFSAVENGIAMTVITSFNADRIANQVTVNVNYGWKSVRRDFGALLLG